MDLRQMDYFLRVARCRSITAAALELGLSQPTLTKSMRLLEEELGVVLFERLPRGVELTEYGQTLKRHAEAVHVQVRDALGEISARRAGSIGTVAIGAGPAWQTYVLPEAISAALSKNPMLRVKVITGYDDALLQALRRGELDFVVSGMPTRDNIDDLELTPLSLDRLGVCCRAGHPLTRRSSIAPEMLTGYGWAVLPERSWVQNRLRALFTTNNLPQPTIAVESESLVLLLQIAGQTDLLTYTARSTLTSPELVLLDMPRFTTDRDAGVITRRNTWLSPAALAIIDELRLLSVLRSSV